MLENRKLSVFLRSLRSTRYTASSSGARFSLKIIHESLPPLHWEAAARPLLSVATQPNQTLYPPPEVMARAEWFATVTPEAQRLRDRLWTEIESA